MSILPSASSGEPRPNTEPFPYRGGHDNPCAYAAGISSNCTCSEPQSTPAPLSPERETEIREREQAATPGHWGVYYDGKGTHTIEAQPRFLPGAETVHDGVVATITAAHGDDQAYRDSEFIAHAREDVPALLAQLDRERAWHKNFEAGVRMAAREIRKRLTEAEAARDELKKRVDEAPSRFSATPAEVDQYLRTILCEDTYLRYQQAIGRAVSAEAAATIRREIETDDEESPANETWLTAADVIDASDMGGPYPSRLLCSKHGGFGPCPGAPWCTPGQDDTEGGA